MGCFECRVIFVSDQGKHFSGIKTVHWVEVAQVLHPGEGGVSQNMSQISKNNFLTPLKQITMCTLKNCLLLNQNLKLSKKCLLPNCLLSLFFPELKWSETKFVLLWLFNSQSFLCRQEFGAVQDPFRLLTRNFCHRCFLALTTLVSHSQCWSQKQKIHTIPITTETLQLFERKEGALWRSLDFILVDSGSDP